MKAQNKKINQQVANESLSYIPLLRITAIASIVIMNTASFDFQSCPVHSFQWQVFNIFNSLARFAVPIFVMIAGVLCLDPAKKLSVKGLFKENLMKMVLIYIFWSLIYAIVQNGLPDSFEGIKGILHGTVSGPPHFWYIPMICGLYLITPFLRILVSHAGKRLLEYFLLLCLVFACILTTLQRLNVLPVLTETMDSLKLNFVAGYTGYYVLGYYLDTYPSKKNGRYALYAAGILSVFVTIAGTFILSSRQGKLDNALYNNLSFNYLLIGAAVFVLYKENMKKINFSFRAVKTIHKVANCAFGIYILHYFSFILFKSLNFHIAAHNPCFSVPLVAACIFFICLLITGILSKIPLFNKYLI